MTPKFQTIFFGVSYIFLHYFQVTRSLANIVSTVDCPVDCICYSDTLDNLESWKWIEAGVAAVQLNDPENQYFNPYTEHNEVYDNPNIDLKRQKSQVQDTLKTVTCIIRDDSSETISVKLESIPANTQVLSILQAPGAGNITLTKLIMERFSGLIGLELQGVSTHDTPDDGSKTSKPKATESVLTLNANALANNKKLRYLSVEKVVMEQRPAEKELENEDVYIKLKSINTNQDREEYDGDDAQDDSNSENQQPFLLFLGIKEKNDPSNNIVPYSEYKKENHDNDKYLLDNKNMKRRAKKSKSKSSPNSISNLPHNPKPKIAVAFTSLSNLVHLRISGCSMYDLSWDMFYKLKSLKFLILDKNDLLFLPDFIFFSTPNLSALSLSGNRILNLQTVGLAGLLHLEKLDVTNNNITHLSELSLPPFPHLQVADFRNNPIEAIFPNTFEIMNTTQSLYLGNPSGTPLEFYANSFYGLISLTRLELTNVKVGSLERSMLNGMPQLLSLTIIDGSIPRIMYDAFNDLPKLEKLTVKRCQVHKISMDALYNLNSLQELDLSHNNLEFLSPGIFDGQGASLRELYLHHNLFTTLPANLFHGLGAIKMIRLEANPWHCSCDMVSWTPITMNMVKRYTVVKNMTNCQPQYDKGHLCNNNVDEQNFQLQPKYMYEKRVTPICSSPAQHFKKTVFQFLQKQRSKCEYHQTKKVRKVPKVKKPSKKEIALDLVSGESAAQIGTGENIYTSPTTTTTTIPKNNDENNNTTTQTVNILSSTTTSTTNTPVASTVNYENDNNNEMSLSKSNERHNENVKKLLGLQTRLKSKMAGRFDKRRNNFGNSMSNSLTLSNNNSNFPQQNHNTNSLPLPSSSSSSSSQMSKKSLKISKLMKLNRKSRDL